MTKPCDFIGNEIDVGDIVAYVPTGYTEMSTETVSKINKKTVTLGEATNRTYRHFYSVIVIKKLGVLCNGVNEP